MLRQVQSYLVPKQIELSDVAGQFYFQKFYDFSSTDYDCFDSVVTIKVEESIVGLYCRYKVPSQDLVVKTNKILIDASVYWNTKTKNKGFEINFTPIL